MGRFIKFNLIVENENGHRRDIVWTQGIEGIKPLRAEQKDHSNPNSGGRKQVNANRAAISFYNEKLRDDQVLRRACAYRKILHDTIDQWKKAPINAGDPPRCSA